MNIPTFEGILTVVATPFDQNGAIAFDVLGKHVDFLLANRIGTIVPGGTTGEYYSQTVEERKKVMSFVAERVGKKAKLVAGTNSQRPDDTIELSKFAKGLGYEALMLAAPFYSLPGTQELAQHFRHIATATGMPIILYNFPARTGVDMNREFLEAINDVKAICAIKESSGSFARMLEHIVHFDGRYQRVCGADDQAVDCFLWGSKSWIAGASNFLPAEHMALYEACVLKKDFVRGQRLMHAMLPMFYLLEQGGKYIQFVKYGCELAGIPVGSPRQPLLPLSEAEKADFRRLYEQLKAAKIGALAA
ncbi:dihydrodipicolinate synthase family protein [Hypericibacter sp.]|uniref:dihydrodipicolinate synthase family protein n=1 Tax=Hypericibacter sp. TaxID=2705401 RepID=UPI003D6DA2E9